MFKIDILDPDVSYSNINVFTLFEKTRYNENFLCSTCSKIVLSEKNVDMSGCRQVRVNIQMDMIKEFCSLFLYSILY
eukprot:m.210306 g.210306  ORF g.210306 m.210306 type:complete len:77 (-) comp19004_c0_seq6:77-307(-)